MRCKTEVKIIAVETGENLKDFVALPWKIYAEDEYWHGQDDKFELASHEPETSFPLTYVERQLFLAIKDGQAVGRISATINEMYNKRWGQNLGFFGHFECIDDQEVANALLNTAEEWIRERGKNEVYGPINYTYYGIVGILIDGFEDHPTVDIPFNPKYYAKLIENSQYVKVRDLYEVLGSVDHFYNKAGKKLSSFYSSVEPGRFHLRTLNENRKDEELLTVLDIYNDAFSEHWLFNRLEADEWLSLMEILYPNLPNELFLIVEDKGTPIAFFFGEHDYNADMFFKRQGLNKPGNRVKAFVMGVRDGYQEYGISKLLMGEISKRCKEMGYEEVSFSWIDEKNIRSFNMCTAMGGPVDKTFRVYGKKL